MVNHTRPISSVYQDGVPPQKAQIRLFETEQDTAIDVADAKAQLALNEIGSSSGGAGGGYSYFSSRAAAIVLPLGIPVGIDAVMTGGYAAEGDCEPMFWVRVGSAPAHAGKFQDAAGAWFELKNERASVTMFGAGVGGDVTTQFANALTFTMCPYVPAGDYIVETLADAGWWGPGRIIFRDALLAIPDAPDRLGWRRAIYQKLVHVARGGCQIGVLGDSISEMYYANNLNPPTPPAVPLSWVNLAQKALMADYSPRCEPEVTNFSSADLYGLTAAGTITIGTEGPVGKSAHMASASSYTFSGYYTFLSLAYIRGGHILTVKRGSTTIATIDTSAGAGEVMGVASATGGTSGSDVYTITASGGVTILTGLQRLRTAIGNPQHTFYFTRCALSGMGFASFNNIDLLTSVVIHALNGQAEGGGTPHIHVALGINDMVNPDIATNAVFAGKNAREVFGFLSRYVTLSYEMPIRPSSASPYVNPINDTWEDFIDQWEQAAGIYGVPVFYPDDYNFEQNDGFHAPDLLHLKANGMEAKFREFMRFLASPSFQTRNQQIHRRKAYTPALSFVTSPGGAWTGFFQGYYFEKGPLCRVLLDISLTGAGTGSGALKVSLPKPAASNAVTGFSYSPGAAGPGRLVGLESGGTDWYVETVAGQSYAYIRSNKTSDGLAYDVSSISATAQIVIALEYLTSDVGG